MTATAVDIAAEIKEHGFCHVPIWETAPKLLHPYLNALKSVAQQFRDSEKVAAIQRGEYKDRLRKWWIARLYDYDRQETIAAGNVLSMVGTLPFLQKPVKEYLGADKLLYNLRYKEKDGRKLIGSHFHGLPAGLPEPKHGDAVYHMPNIWYIPPNRGGADREWSEKWHCDPESSRIVKVFWWMSEVDEESGPMQFAKVRYKRGAYLKDNYAPHPDDVATFTCPEDTLTFVDTSHFHRGGYTGANGRLCANWCFFVREKGGC